MNLQDFEKLLKQNNFEFFNKVEISSLPHKFEYFIPEEMVFNLPYEKWDELAERKDLKIMLGGYPSHLDNIYSEHGTVTNYYTFWLFELIFQINFPNNKSFHQLKNTKINKLGICLNNIPKLHRRMMMQKLEECQILDDLHYSWVTPRRRSSSYKIWKYEKQQKLLDEMDKDSDLGKQFRIPNKYFESFIDIVNETSIEIPFITEKTWKPLLLGRPFIVNGCMGYHHLLKKLGFELYDEIFDYEFDFKNLEYRIFSIANQVADLKEKDFTQLYKKLLPKIKYNQNVLFEYIENRVGFEDVEIENINSTFQKKKFIKHIAISKSFDRTKFEI